MTSIAADQLLAWQRDGWLVLREAFSSETIAALDTGVTELSAWAASGGPGLHHFEQTGSGPALARSERFADDHTVLGSFVTTGPVLDHVASVLGEAAVLFKEKVNYKHPGGGGFAPHQDATAYRFVDHHVSAMVPLDSSTIASGCLSFAPGYRRGQLDTDDRGRIAEHAAGALDWQPIEAEPGDLVLFDSYAPHYSESNTTDRSRRALYLTYNAARLGDHRARYYADKEAEFARLGESFDGERVRISINDDFLGVPVAAPYTEATEPDATGLDATASDATERDPAGSNT